MINIVLIIVVKIKILMKVIKNHSVLINLMVKNVNNILNVNKVIVKIKMIKILVIENILIVINVIIIMNVNLILVDVINQLFL